MASHCPQDKVQSPKAASQILHNLPSICASSAMYSLSPVPCITASATLKMVLSPPDLSACPGSLVSAQGLVLALLAFREPCKCTSPNLISSCDRKTHFKPASNAHLQLSIGYKLGPVQILLSKSSYVRGLCVWQLTPSSCRTPL